MTQHELGQYFTRNIRLQKIVYNLIKNNPNSILEPSVGRGDLVSYIISQNDTIHFDCYEIDGSIDFIIDPHDITICDFLKADMSEQYTTIIGNPPYVRTTRGNLYIDFISKCVDLLKSNGELIFIVPSDFFKLTSSCEILNRMMTVGTFTDIVHPEDEALFSGASIDVIVFRYVLSPELPKLTMYNSRKKYIINTNGVITFSDHPDDEFVRFGELFDVYVGMVSGRDGVFRNEDLGNLDLLTGAGQVKKYILIHKFPTDNAIINEYMLKHREELKTRRIRKFNDSNWFEWGALRNYKRIGELLGRDCIYVHNLTRKGQVAFRNRVQYFGGNLLIAVPKDKSTIKKIDCIVDYINSTEFRSNYMYSGRFKIGYRNLCNGLLPLNML